MQEYKNENEMWSHAIPLEDKRISKDLETELTAMKELFFEQLPIGENVDTINDYFNRLEKAIYTKEDVKREEFPDDQGNDHGSDISPGEQQTADRKQPNYRYISAAVFKQQASRHQSQPSPQDMDRSGLCQDEGSISQGKCKECESVASV